MKRLRPFFIVFTFLTFAGNLVAQDIYLYYPGITDGKGTLEIHRDEVRLTSVAGGMHRESNTTMFLPYSMTKSYDGSSPLLMSNLTKGTRGDDVEIRFYSQGKSGEEELALKIELKGTMIVSYQSAGTPCESCPTLSETFSIDFERIKIGTFIWDRIKGR